MAANRTIVLKGDLAKWHEEKVIKTATAKPGYLVELTSDDKVQPHATRGGRSQKWFAKEDDLRGGTIDGLDGDGVAYYTLTGLDGSTPDKVMIHRAQPGDEINAALKFGESVTRTDYVMSNGDGRVCKAAAAVLQNNVAASSNVTNTTTETTFSNGTVTLPANSLKVGDVIRVRAQVLAPTTNSTDTLTIKGYFTSQQLFTTGAVDVANNDIGTFDIFVVIRTIGASGTAYAYGVQSLGVPGTVTAKPFNVASFAIDTTVANTITLKATWSVASASDIVALQALTADKIGTVTQATAGGMELVGQALETLDLSALTDDDFLAIEIL